jgi:hypothetical protein
VLSLSLCVAAACLASASGQELLDRIVARIGTTVITMSDVNAASALGVVPGFGFQEATEQMIERQLVLAEVARFAPPDPDPEAIEREVAAMRMRAGDRLPQVMRTTGTTDERLRELARDTLRIEGYLNQRFGPAAQRNDVEVRQWLQGLRARASITIPAAR